jgi:hypothetical protein
VVLINPDNRPYNRKTARRSRRKKKNPAAFILTAVMAVFSVALLAFAAYFKPGNISGASPKNAVYTDGNPEEHVDYSREMLYNAA